MNQRRVQVTNTIAIETTDAPRLENTVIRLVPVITDQSPRCWRCRRELAIRASRPWEFVCARCKALNASAP